MRRWIKILPKLSLCLCLLMAGLWAVSAYGDWHFGYSGHHTYYIFRLYDQSFGMYHPPGKARAAQEIWHLSAQMRNGDFVWQRPVEARDGWMMEGDVAPGSATDQMYRRVEKIIHEPQMEDLADSDLLEAVRDPKRFVPAHMLLLFQTGDWRHANAWGGGPRVFIPSDCNSIAPDLSRCREIAEQWHIRLDVPVFRFWVGWPVLLLMILPCARLVRPRGPAITTMQRAGAAATLVSLLGLFMLCVGWARSYDGDEWDLPARSLHAALPAGLYRNASYEEYVQPMIISSGGQLQVLAAHQGRDPKEKMPLVEHTRETKLRLVALGPAAGKTIESRWNYPGISYTGFPTQTVMRSLPRFIIVPTTMPQRLAFIGPPTPATRRTYILVSTTMRPQYKMAYTAVPKPVLGAHSLIISYRWLVAAALVMPI